MEQLGQKHTNQCIDCDVDLVLGGNWTEARKEQSKYLCKTCWQSRDSLRMYVNGKHISKSHPLYKAGRYKSFGDAAFSSLANYETAKEGQVYIVVNPAFPSWCKIGMAVDAEDRLKQYQTSSPYRDYKLIATYDTSDRRKAEKFAHDLLEKRHERRGEWFCIQHPVAASILELPMREFQ